jgi:RimJ/RimL family protein N-acetyltransferase
VSVALALVGPDLRDAVLALAPAPDQVRWCGLPTETLPVAEADPERLAVAILAGGAPAGFFVLHRGPGALPLAPPPGTVLLRGFFVDARAQGRGVAAGALAALPAFARAHLPGAEAIVLGVNVRNPAARRAYERAGFAATGAQHQGELGPQDVLRLELAGAALAG